MSATPNTGLPAMSRWTAAFSDPELEAAYLRDWARTRGRLTRRFTPFAIVVWCAFSAWDWAFVPASELPTMELLRHGIGTAGLLLAFALDAWGPEPGPRRLTAAVVIGSASPLAVCLAAEALLPANLFPILFAGLSIIVFVIHTLPGTRVAQVAPVTLGACAGYFALGVAARVPSRLLWNDGTWVVCAELMALVTNVSLERLTRTNWAQQRSLDAERRRSEQLLLNVLPEAVARRLKAGESPIADRVDAVTVLFADIVGFTPLSQQLTPEALVGMLDGLFRRFDAIAAAHGLEKIKTIGDAYMAVAGLPTRCDDHARRAARAALDMRDAVASLGPMEGATLSVRIGLHSGSVVAGVIGSHKFSYDVWGDTVNLASRMESHGVPGSVHLTAEVVAALGDGFRTEARGEVDLKGKGKLSTWLLLGAA